MAYTPAKVLVDSSSSLSSTWLERGSASICSTSSSSLDELELALVEQVLLLTVELELDLEHTEQVLRSVELGVDLLDVLNLLDAEQVDLLDVEQVEHHVEQVDTELDGLQHLLGLL